MQRSFGGRGPESSGSARRNTEARDSKCSIIDFSETGDFRISARVIHQPSSPRENAKEEDQRDFVALPYGRSCRATGMRVSCAHIGCSFEANA